RALLTSSTRLTSPTISSTYLRKSRPRGPIATVSFAYALRRNRLSANRAASEELRTVSLIELLRGQGRTASGQKSGQISFENTPLAERSIDLRYATAVQPGVRLIQSPRRRGRGSMAGSSGQASWRS